MNKFTAGPWLIERDKVGPRIESDGQDDGMMMPVAYIEKFDYPDQYQANTRLISAAPDLLEALECLLDTYSKPDQGLCCSGRDCGCMGATIYDQAEHYARDAIAKARGEA